VRSFVLCDKWLPQQQADNLSKRVDWAEEVKRNNEN